VHYRNLPLAALVLVLPACGGDETATPAPSQPTTSAPPPTPAPSGSYGEGYDEGTSYPAAASPSLSAASVPAGATVIHVPVTLDHETPNTVVTRVSIYNGSGGKAEPETTKAVVFRPGDPLTKTVSFNVSGMSEGNSVQLLQDVNPAGGTGGGGSVLMTAQAGASNAPSTGGRAPVAFAPVGQLVYDVTGQTIKFDDEGGPDSFSTALSHGRTQPANPETGYYGTIDMGGFERSGDTLVLKTLRLPQPIDSNGKSYPYLSSILSGHNTTAAQFKYGTVEWQVKMPNRDGTWPALWLLSDRGWPPEIDVYEGFGYVNGWNFSSYVASDIHGGANGQKTFSRSGTVRMRDWGLDPTLDSEFHTFAATITPEWITLFIDGTETMQYANPFAGATWYPLTQLTTTAAAGADYDQGKGTMELRSLKIWRQV